MQTECHFVSLCIIINGNSSVKGGLVVEPCRGAAEWAPRPRHEQTDSLTTTTMTIKTFFGFRYSYTHKTNTLNEDRRMALSPGPRLKKRVRSFGANRRLQMTRQSLLSYGWNSLVCASHCSSYRGISLYPDQSWIINLKKAQLLPKFGPNVYYPSNYCKG